MSTFESYLGLPTLIGRSKYHTFSFIKDRVWKKLQGWKGMMLSKAGKEVLIKAVAQAIPTYTMSVFSSHRNYVRSWMVYVLGFGGIKLGMKGKFIGRVGIN